MKRVETSLSDKQYAKALRISKRRKVSMYALLKEALLGYLDTFADNLGEGIVAATEKVADKLGDRFPVLTEKVADAFDDDKIDSVSGPMYERYSRAARADRLLEEKDSQRQSQDREEETLDLFLQTMQRIRELPPEEFDAYVASLEGLLKQVESEKPSPGKKDST